MRTPPLPGLLPSLPGVPGSPRGPSGPGAPGNPCCPGGPGSPGWPEGPGKPTWPFSPGIPGIPWLPVDMEKTVVRPGLPAPGSACRGVSGSRSRKSGHVRKCRGSDPYPRMVTDILASFLPDFSSPINTCMHACTRAYTHIYTRVRTRIHTEGERSAGLTVQCEHTGTWLCSLGLTFPAFPICKYLLCRSQQMKQPCGHVGA